MARLIDADALERAVMGLGEDVVCDDCAYEFANLIDEQPTIEAEPVRHGHWELSLFKGMYICSNCRQYYIRTDEAYDFNYCPHCGAKLDEVSE